MNDYKIFNEKEKRKIFELVKKELSRFGIKNFLVYGSFVKRNYLRDLDLVIFDKISEEKMNSIASSLEKKIKIEVDLRRFDELPEPIKYLALTQGKGRIEGKFRKEAFDFLRVYIDFVEWLKKWS
jgi:predicted nucleotidyltransferase